MQDRLWEYDECRGDRPTTLCILIACSRLFFFSPPVNLCSRANQTAWENMTSMKLVQIHTPACRAETGNVGRASSHIPTKNNDTINVVCFTYRSMCCFIFRNRRQTPLPPAQSSCCHGGINPTVTSLAPGTHGAVCHSRVWANIS